MGAKSSRARRSPRNCELLGSHRWGWASREVSVWWPVALARMLLASLRPGVRSVTGQGPTHDPLPRLCGLYVCPAFP